MASEGDCGYCGHSYCNHDKKICRNGQRGAVIMCDCTGFVFSKLRDFVVIKPRITTQERVNELFLKLLDFQSNNPKQMPKPEDIGARQEEIDELFYGLEETRNFYQRLGIG